MAIIRLMTESDIPDVISVWKEVNLSLASQCVKTFFDIDPYGFYVAEENGITVGFCAAVIQNEDLAAVGLYAVRPTHQGKGIGIKAWKKAMTHAGERNCFLNAIPRYFHIYKEKAGFAFVDKHSTIIWKKNTVSTEMLVNHLDGVTIKPVNEEIVEQMIVYDKHLAGYNRSEIISNATHEKDCISLVAIKNGEICGYGTLRDNILGTKLLAPLYADSPDIAELILYHLLRLAPSSKECGLTYMGIDANPSCIELAQKLGLEKVYTLPRMYTKAVLNARFEKVYSQLNLDFCNI